MSLKLFTHHLKPCSDINVSADSLTPSLKKVEPNFDFLECVLDLDTLASIKNRIATFEAKS